jgi:hypothetical protein
VLLPAASLTPRPHVHPHQEEVLMVESGELDVLVDGEWRRLGTGGELAVQPGQVHTFRNASSEIVQVRTIHRPALSLERYLERVYWLSAMNRIRHDRSASSLLYLALVWDTHRDHQLVAGRMRQMGVRVLARVARLLGFRIDREED